MHHEQQFPNSCVAACMCMVEARRGLPFSEAEFHAGAPPKGFDVTSARALSSVEIKAIGPGEEQEIDTALLLGGVVLAKILAAPYVKWLASHHPGLQSRHGSLGPPGDFGGSPHCVLLVARSASPDGYRFHDPWYPGTIQPLFIADDDFQRCFGGLVAIAEM